MSEKRSEGLVKVLPVWQRKEIRRSCTALDKNMNRDQAEMLVSNLIDRRSTDRRLGELMTDREIEALRFLIGDPPAPSDAPSQALRPPAPPMSAEAVSPVVQNPPEPMPAYAGNLHLCLDFGTAVSKAFAWDAGNDEPKPLAIGEAMGEAGSRFLLQSTLFISRDGRVYCGETGYRMAATADPSSHRALQSIKDLLTVGQKEVLSRPLMPEYNPTDVPLMESEAIVLYLAYLTDAALRALEQLGENNVRAIPRSYTKPVFEAERDPWATEILTECAAMAHLVADEFSGQWDEGIPLANFRHVVDTFASQTPEWTGNLISRDTILPEPVAAFVARFWGIEPTGTRRIFMVIDVGAGTTDFAMFAQWNDDDGNLRIAPVKGSVTTVRFAGDRIDEILRVYILHKAGVTSDNPQHGHIVAGLQREIRLIKEELFSSRAVRHRLVNDVDVTVDLEEFLRTDGMLRMGKGLEARFREVLEGVDSSFLALGDLPVFFTGGGASLEVVTNLAHGQEVWIGDHRITLRAATPAPGWLEGADALDEVVDLYPQLAVSIGGACGGAGMTPNILLQARLPQFGGNIPSALWKPDIVRKGPQPHTGA